MSEANFFLPEVWAVELPKQAWECLLEILEAQQSEHGGFDFTTVRELHQQIADQTFLEGPAQHAPEIVLNQVLGGFDNPA